MDRKFQEAALGFAALGSGTVILIGAQAKTGIGHLLVVIGILQIALICWAILEQKSR